VLNFADILIVDNLPEQPSGLPKRAHAHIEGHLVFMRIRSVDMYFTKYLGDESNVLNGFIMQSNKIYLFRTGVRLKHRQGTRSITVTWWPTSMKK